MSNNEPNIGVIAITFFGLILLVRAGRKLKEPRPAPVRIQREPLTTRPRPYRSRTRL